MKAAKKKTRRRPPKVVIIERSKWYRGHGGCNSALVEKASGCKCCLGFVGLACGYTEAKMSGLASPEGCLVKSDPRPAWPKWMLELYARTDGYVAYVDTADTEAAMQINDDMVIGDAEREKKLTALFKKNGMTLRFVP